MDLWVRLIIGAVLGAAVFQWGLRTGRKREYERTQWELDRLAQEGRMSASLRILRQRLNGDTNYDEPLPQPDKEST